MPDVQVPTFESITPRLPTRDMLGLLTFYRDHLGFAVGWTWGEPVTHANLCRDAISVDLLHVAEPTTPVLAYIVVRGVDAYFAELTRRGVSVSPIADRPYGMRDFEVEDPSGNRLAFGEPCAS